MKRVSFVHLFVCHASKTHPGFDKSRQRYNIFFQLTIIAAFFLSKGFKLCFLTIVWTLVNGKDINVDELLSKKVGKVYTQKCTFF